MQQLEKVKIKSIQKSKRILTNKKINQQWLTFLQCFFFTMYKSKLKFNQQCFIFFYNLLNRFDFFIVF